jgi:hypothetical protein
MMSHVILLAGKAESGKTLAANIIKEEIESLGKTALIMSFAGYLKFICKSYYKWDGKKNEEGRSLLQRLGTDVVRKKNPDFWAKTVFDFITTFDGEFDYFILDDTRFKNEISIFEEYNPLCYTSVRIGRLNYENSLSPSQRLHPSETDLDNINLDVTVYSNTGEENLRKAIVNKLFTTNQSKALLGLL